jgi:ParB/RepB/Spo0J family partition protein
MSETNETPVTLTGAMRLNYDVLFASPTNPRRHFDEAALKELSENIREHGVLMPLMVRKVEERYEIVAGERRYRALGIALETLASEGEQERYGELYSVPVIVRELTDGQVLALQLIENLQRKDLTALEEAEGYQRLVDLPGENAYTPAMISKTLNVSVDTILNKLRMLKAPKFMREALEAGQCSERHLVLVASVPREDAREKAAKQILAGSRWDKPLTVQDSVMLLNDTYRRSLKGVLFSLDDAELLTEAGPCSTCPHFAKKAAEQDKDLAEELGNGRGKLEPLTCLQPSCFKAKQEALLARKKEQAKEEQVELKVLTKPEAQKIFNSTASIHSSLTHRSGMVRLDDKLGHDIYGHYNQEKMVTWREATEGLLPAGSVMVAKMDDGSLVEILEEKVAKAAAKQHPKHGKLFVKAAKAELNPEQEREKAREAFERRQKEHARFIILDLIDERAATVGMNEETMLVVLDVALRDAGSDGCKLLASWLKLEPKAPEGMQLNQTYVREAILEHLKVRGSTKAELDRLVLMAMLSRWVKIYACEFDGLAPVEQRLGFDSKTVMALAKSKVQAEDAAKKAKAKEKAPKAKDTEQINAEVKTKAILEEGDEQRAKMPSRKGEDAEMGRRGDAEMGGPSDNETMRQGDSENWQELKKLCREWRAENPGRSVSAMAEELGIPHVLACEISDELVDEKHDAKAKVKRAEAAQAEAEAEKIFEFQARAVANGAKPSEFIGGKPDPKKNPEGYKEWNAKRMKLERAAKKLKQAA